MSGECNIKFGLKPNSREYVVIEVNPRSSEFTPLVSKATGYPVSKVSGLLAAGYSIPEVSNRIQKMIILLQKWTASVLSATSKNM